MNISMLTDDYGVAPQVLADDIAAIADAGFVAIICNRPDNEDPGQPMAADIRAECDKLGVSFHHIPVSGMPLAADAITEQRRIVEASEGRVLAYCRSGQRAALIWEASA